MLLRKATVGVLLLSEIFSGAYADGTCDETGYEVWRQAPPEDIDMSVDVVESEDGCGYDLAIKFKPPTGLPYLNDVSATAFITSDPAGFNAVCDGEGRPENDAFPVRTADKADDHHVGLNDNFAEYTYTMELDASTKALTGVDHVTVGAAPCGTKIQPYPHYNIHFYRVSIKERMEMKCVTEGGFFCKPYDQQCSEAGRKFNINGDVERCEEGYGAPANIPLGYSWTDDYSPVGNAASAGMGLHGLNPRTLPPPLGGGDPTMPNTLFLDYDKEIVANHIVMWSGFPLGEATATEYTLETPFYNCADDVKYGTRAKKFESKVEGGYTTVSISGQTSTCSWEAPPAPCKSGILRIGETFDFIQQVSVDGVVDLTPGVFRDAGDYDVWDDNIFLFQDPDPTGYNVANPAYPGSLIKKIGKHYGKCTYVGPTHASHCEGSMYIDHPDVGKGIISIMGGSPVAIGDFPSYMGGEVQFTVTGGTGSFTGASGVVSPGIQPFTMDPDGVGAEAYPSFAYPLPGNTDLFLAISYDINLTCPNNKSAKKAGKQQKNAKKASKAQ